MSRTNSSSSITTALLFLIGIDPFSRLRPRSVFGCHTLYTKNGCNVTRECAGSRLAQHLVPRRRRHELGADGVMHVARDDGIDLLHVMRREFPAEHLLHAFELLLTARAPERD